jgi:hypothetical protein
MADIILFAQRINNGQSEIWSETHPAGKRVLATNGIVYPIRSLCPKEESEAFYKAFNDGIAAVPATVTDRLVSDFALRA